MKKTKMGNNYILLITVICSVILLMAFGAFYLQIINRNNRYTYSFLDNTLIITGFNEKGAGKNIRIPNEINAIQVKGIGQYAFDNEEKIKKVVIDDGIEYIYDYAFANCENLEEVVLPNSIKYIGEDAFIGCDKLKFYTYENGDYLGNRKNRYVAYVKVNNLDNKNIILHDETRTIVSSALKEMEVINEITISKYIKEIDINLFNNSKVSKINVSEENRYYTSVLGNLYSKDQSKLIRYANGKSEASFVVPDSVQYIESLAFANATSLENVRIYSKVKEIGKDAFIKCKNLNYNRYGNALYLGNVDNPYQSLIKPIHNSIVEFEVHPNTHLIANSAFVDCYYLTKIVVPNNVKYIGLHAFTNCHSLVEASLPFIGNSSNDDNCYLGYIFKSNDYSNHNSGVPQNLNKVIITGETLLESFAFSGCQNLQSVVLTGNVTEMGERVFASCKNLEEVILNEGLENIGSYAFFECESLINVYIPESITKISSFAFYKCNMLEKIEIPNSVKFVDEMAFLDCKKLQIYVNLESCPSTWNERWNPQGIIVHWNE